MPYPDGTLLKGSGPEIYVIEAGRRRWIACCITFDAKGYDWNKINFISDQDLNAIPLGEPMTSDTVHPTWREADRLIRSRIKRLKVHAGTDLA